MSAKRDEELMLLHDGELSEREARAAEERAAASPEDHARLDALAEIGEVLRARMEMAVEEAGPALDGMWAKLERQLEPEPERPPARPARPAGEAEEEAGGFLAWISAWRGYFVTGAVCAAAGALLALWLRAPKVIERDVPRIVEVPAPREEAPSALAENKEAEVESLEVVGGTGTVFHIPGEKSDEAPTTVIWVTRDEPGPEGPI